MSRAGAAIINLAARRADDASVGHATGTETVAVVGTDA